jgi:hypothetical protein
LGGDNDLASTMARRAKALCETDGRAFWATSHAREFRTYDRDAGEFLRGHWFSLNEGGYGE